MTAPPGDRAYRTREDHAHRTHDQRTGDHDGDSVIRVRLARTMSRSTLVPHHGRFSTRLARCCMCQGPVSRLRFPQNVFRQTVLVDAVTRKQTPFRRY